MANNDVLLTVISQYMNTEIFNAIFTIEMRIIDLITDESSKLVDDKIYLSKDEVLKIISEVKEANCNAG